MVVDKNVVGKGRPEGLPFEKIDCLVKSPEFVMPHLIRHPEHTKTNLNAVWKDPECQGGKLKNVLAVGGSTNEIIRRIFEDEFTAKLIIRGTNAIQSYSIFLPKKKQRIKKQGERIAPPLISTIKYLLYLLTHISFLLTHRQFRSLLHESRSR